MKRRRNLLVALLLVCAMGIGVGYAAITDTLVMNGTTTIEQEAPKLEITSMADSTDPSDVGTFSDFSGPAKSVTFNVTGLRNPGDKAIATFTITNKNDFPMYLTGISVVDTNDKNDAAGVTSYYNVTTNYNSIVKDLAATGESGDSVEIVVTVTLEKAYVNPDAGSTAAHESNFSITINGSSVDSTP